MVDEVTAENVNMNLEDIRLSEENLGIKKILGDLIIEGDLKISSLDSQVRMRSGSNNATYVIEGKRIVAIIYVYFQIYRTQNSLNIF